jgi:hypothetical protein
MKQLAKAILAVMQEVKGIEKNSTVGSGNYAYKGVNDQDVKKIIGESMAKHGLTLLPIDVEPTIHIERWEETYNGITKQKQNVLAEVKTKYLLLHESGESQTISGYGHGIDSMDKSAGKATTYALKYALLYAFLIPTGKIDDADNHHSEEIQVPIKAKTTQKKLLDEKGYNFLIKEGTVEQINTALKTRVIKDAWKTQLQSKLDLQTA